MYFTARVPWASALNVRETTWTMSDTTLSSAVTVTSPFGVRPANEKDTVLPSTAPVEPYGSAMAVVGGEAEAEHGGDGGKQGHDLLLHM